MKSILKKAGKIVFSIHTIFPVSLCLNLDSETPPGSLRPCTKLISAGSMPAATKTALLSVPVEVSAVSDTWVSPVYSFLIMGRSRTDRTNSGVGGKGLPIGTPAAIGAVRPPSARLAAAHLARVLL